MEHWAKQLEGRHGPTLCLPILVVGYRVCDGCSCCPPCPFTSHPSGHLQGLVPPSVKDQKVEVLKPRGLFHMGPPADSRCSASFHLSTFPTR